MENNTFTICRITAVHKNRYECITDQGQPCFAQLKRTAYMDMPCEWVPTVGDLVHIVQNPDGDSHIINTLPRKTLLKRADPSGQHEQLLAANVDRIFMLTSANDDFNIKRLRRYLMAARQSGAQFTCVINKADLQATDVLRQMTVEAEQVSGSGSVLCISCRTGEGMMHIRERMVPGSISVFLGSSGVGKSTLVNTLMGEDVMQTGRIREDDAKGRHTTTGRQMLFLPNGAMIIDTPGMRELGLWQAENEVGETFADISAMVSRCRFSNCTHTYEAGCMVQQAIAKGMLTMERWQEYKQLYAEARARKQPKHGKRPPQPPSRKKWRQELDEDDDF